MDFDHGREFDALQEKLIVHGIVANNFDTDLTRHAESVMSFVESLSDSQLIKMVLDAKKYCASKKTTAVLLAILSRRDGTAFRKVFPDVIDDLDWLRLYTKIIVSGVIGKRIRIDSSKCHKKAYQQFFDEMPIHDIFVNDMAAQPHLSSIIKFGRIAPKSKEREAVFQYMLNRKLGWKLTKGLVFGATMDDLPDFVKEHLHDSDSKLDQSFLNVCRKLNVFELYEFYLKHKNELPNSIVEVIKEAVEVSLENVPNLGRVYIACDASLSMNGYYKNNIRFIDVAGFISLALFKRANNNSSLFVFSDKNKQVYINARDSLFTNIEKLIFQCQGGTNFSLPFSNCGVFDTFILISDGSYGKNWDAAGLDKAWSNVKERFPDARMINIDLMSQTSLNEDVLNIFGFNDECFAVMNSYSHS